jgi:HAMP domain-containing protein
VNSQFVKFTCKTCKTPNVVENPAFDSSSPDDFAPEDVKQPKRAPMELKGFSIRSKITFIFVVLVLASLTIVGLIASQRSSSALLAEAKRSLQNTANQKAREYTLSFERIQQEAESVSGMAKELYERKTPVSALGLDKYILMPWTGSGYGNPEMNRTLLPEVLTVQQLVPVLKNLSAKNPLTTAIYLGSTSRVMAMSNDQDVAAISKLQGYENIKRPWYIKAKEKNKTIWTDPYIDASTQDLIVTCATPVVLDNKSLAGVIGFDVRLSTIQKDILTLDIGYGSYAMLVDNQGKALVRPGMAKGDRRWDQTYNTTDLKKTDNPEFNAIIGRMISGQSAVESFVSEDGPKYVAYAPLPSIGASMAIVARKDMVIEPAVAMRNWILVVWAAVLVITVFIGILVGNGITKPINELTRAADLISQGRLGLNVLPPSKRQDEIGLLTLAFNRLVTSLRIAMSRK